MFRDEGKRAFRYGLVGVGNTIVGLGSYALFLTVGVNYLLAGAMAWILGTAHGYTWNRIWTFEGAPHGNERAARYAAVGLVGLVLNALALALFVGVAGLPRFAAGALAVPIVVVVTFALNRWWTFRAHLDGAGAG